MDAVSIWIGRRTGSGRRSESDHLAGRIAGVPAPEMQDQGHGGRVRHAVLEMEIRATVLYPAPAG